jgi:hypothetical protein
MTGQRATAARTLRELDGQLEQMSLAYQLARAAKERGDREDWITLDYISGMYHDMAALFFRIHRYLVEVEGFTSEELSRIASMSWAELSTTREFLAKEDGR